MQNQKALVWFRNNLRISDNKLLFKASKAHNNIIAYYNFDSNFFKKDRWGFIRTEKFRAKFLIETVKECMLSIPQQAKRRWGIDYDMPVGIEIKIGSNWLDTKEIFSN